MVGLLELFLQQAQLAQRSAVLGQQALIVAVQLGDFILAYQCALLGLAQFHLNLLHLAFMATLFLLALLFDGGAVVLQGVAGVQVFLFEGADLLVLVLQA
ncbi:hypothetical protein D3C86_1844490 [compost metagenome]